MKRSTILKSVYRRFMMLASTIPVPILFGVIATILVGAMLVAGSIVSAQSGSSFAIKWWSVDGGGGRSEAGGFSLNGTAGQVEAEGEMSSGVFALVPGFQAGIVASTTPTPSDPIGQDTPEPGTPRSIYVPAALLATVEPTPTPATLTWTLVAGSDVVAQNGDDGFDTLFITEDRRLLAGARQEFSNNGGLYTTSNAVASCDAIPPVQRLPEPESAVYDIINASGQLWAATYSPNLWSSDNLGQTWTNATESIADEALANDVAVDGGNIYVTTEERGLFYSDTNGSTWGSIRDVPLVLNMAVSYRGTIWVGTHEAGPYALNASNNNVTSLLGNLTGNEQSIHDIAFWEDTGEVFLATNGGVLRGSGDGQWVPMNLPATQTTRSLEVNQGMLFVGTERSGVWRTPLDAISWEEVNGNDGISNAIVRDLLFDSEVCQAIFAATDRGIFILN